MISNAKQAVLEATLFALGVTAEKVDLIAGIDTIQSNNYLPKPDAGSYLFGIHQLSQKFGREVNPEKCIGMEDSRSGYQSLLNAGIGWRVYCSNVEGLLLPQDAHYVIRPHDDVKKLSHALHL